MRKSTSEETKEFYKYFCGELYTNERKYNRVLKAAESINLEKIIYSEINKYNNNKNMSDILYKTFVALFDIDSLSSNAEGKARFSKAIRKSSRILFENQNKYSLMSFFDFDIVKIRSNGAITINDKDIFYIHKLKRLATYLEDDGVSKEMFEVFDDVLILIAMDMPGSDEDNERELVLFMNKLHRAYPSETASMIKKLSSEKFSVAKEHVLSLMKNLNLDTYYKYDCLFDSYDEFKRYSILSVSKGYYPNYKYLLTIKPLIETADFTDETEALVFITEVAPSIGIYIRRDDESYDKLKKSDFELCNNALIYLCYLLVDRNKLTSYEKYFTNYSNLFQEIKTMVYQIIEDYRQGLPVKKYSWAMNMAGLTKKELDFLDTIEGYGLNISESILQKVDRIRPK